VDRMRSASGAGIGLLAGCSQGLGPAPSPSAEACEIGLAAAVAAEPAASRDGTPQTPAERFAGIGQSAKKPALLALQHHSGDDQATDRFERFGGGALRETGAGNGATAARFGLQWGHGLSLSRCWWRGTRSRWPSRPGDQHDFRRSPCWRARARSLVEAAGFIEAQLPFESQPRWWSHSTGGYKVLTEVIQPGPSTAGCAWGRPLAP